MRRWDPAARTGFYGGEQQGPHTRSSRQLWEAGADGKERNVQSKDKRLTSQSLKLLSLLLFPTACTAPIIEAAMRSREAESAAGLSNTHPMSRLRDYRHRTPEGYGVCGLGQPPPGTPHPAVSISLPPLKGSKDTAVVKKEP